MNNGKAWATFGFWVGILASVSANIAHSYIRVNPQAGAIIAAAFWPIALLISLEVISRVRWPVGWTWWLTRYAGLTSVATIAAIVSYRHMAGLLASYGEDGFSAAIGPLSVDGLMVVCSVALLAIADNRRAAAVPLAADAAETTLDETIEEVEVFEDITPESLPPIEPEPEPEPVPITIHEQAQLAYLESTKNGHVLTGKELGEMFQRSPRWGRAMIAKANQRS